MLKSGFPVALGLTSCRVPEGPVTATRGGKSASTSACISLSLAYGALSAVNFWYKACGKLQESLFHAKVPSQRRSTHLEPNFHTPSCSSPHVSSETKLLALHSKFHTLLRCWLFKLQTKLTYGLSCYGLYPSDFHVLSSRTRSSFQSWTSSMSSLGYCCFLFFKTNIQQTAAKQNMQDNFRYDISWHLKEIISCENNPVFPNIQHRKSEILLLFQTHLVKLLSHARPHELGFWPWFKAIRNL